MTNWDPIGPTRTHWDALGATAVKATGRLVSTKWECLAPGRRGEAWTQVVPKMSENHEWANCVRVDQTENRIFVGRFWSRLTSGPYSSINRIWCSALTQPSIKMEGGMCLIREIGLGSLAHCTRSGNVCVVFICYALVLLTWCLFKSMADWTRSNSSVSHSCKRSTWVLRQLIRQLNTTHIQILYWQEIAGLLHVQSTVGRLR